MIDFIPTHRLILHSTWQPDTFVDVSRRCLRPNGLGLDEQEVFREGPAYTRREWLDEHAASWQRDAEGLFTYCGENPPEGADRPMVVGLEDGKPAREEVEKLKAQWRADPCWDLEDTVGFTEHREELLAYSEQVKQERQAADEAELDARAEELGVPGNRKLAMAFKRLHDRIDYLQDQLIEKALARLAELESAARRSRR